MCNTYIHNSCQRQQFLTAWSDNLLLKNLLHMSPRLMGHGRKYQESGNFNLEKQHVCTSAKSQSLPPFKSRKLWWNWSSYISDYEFWFWDIKLNSADTLEEHGTSHLLDRSKQETRMKPATSRAKMLFDSDCITQCYISKDTALLWKLR